MVEVFQDYAYYYNAFYSDKDYKYESIQVSKLLKLFGGGCKKDSLLNLGCGTGKHDIELSALGYVCTGIDMSPLMIQIAKQYSQSIKVPIDFQVADIREYEPRRKYDAVISLFHVMSYQNSNDDICSAFNTARKALDVGGLFLFDVWYGPGVLSDKPVVRVKEIEDEKYKLLRIARPVMHDQKNIVDVCYEILVINKESGVVQTMNEIHSMRYFFRPELELLLNIAGFELLENLNCLDLGKTTYDTWTSYFIARAV